MTKLPADAAVTLAGVALRDFPFHTVIGLPGFFLNSFAAFYFWQMTVVNGGRCNWNEEFFLFFSIVRIVLIILKNLIGKYDGERGLQLVKSEI